MRLVTRYRNGFRTGLDKPLRVQRHFEPEKSIAHTEEIFRSEMSLGGTRNARQASSILGIRHDTYLITFYQMRLLRKCANKTNC